MSALRDVVEVVARALADHPDQVSVTETEHRQTTLEELYMAPGDLGRVIGRQGRTAQARPGPGRQGHGRPARGGPSHPPRRRSR